MEGSDLIPEDGATHYPSDIRLLAAKRAVEDLLRKIANKQQDPDVALDAPSWVCWTVIVDALGMFEEVTGRRARRVYLPRTVEILVDAYAAKHVRYKKSLRDTRRLLGLEAILDAPSFKFD